jgi:photosystem II stability/assembly factor-like uncharacterized protein
VTAPRSPLGLVALLALTFATAALGATAPAGRRGAAPPDAHLKGLSFRAIGPANMGGRVSDVAAVESKPTTFYVALGTGGLMKTVNAGTTWSAVFEKEAVASIGAVAVWQKNPSVVWVGTGETNNRNSSSWGNGVYRSSDAGATWTHLGLAATHNISSVIPHPTDSLTAWVAAMGRLWGENAERGVYVTRDGGRTWSQALKTDARTGAIDLVIDPENPSTLYAALYARKRTPWSYTAGGTTGGIFRTRDGGRTWTKLTNGLPQRTGRIGLDVCRAQPRTIVAVVESDEGGRIDDFEDKSRAGGVFRSDDGGDTWTRLSPHTPRPFYFSKIRVQPDDPSRVYLLGFDLMVSDDGGRTFRAGGARNLHPDLHAMWVNPANPEHVILGTDGGVYQSFDRTKNWDYLDNMAAGEFYNVAVDLGDPYRICGGLQDNQVWCGPSRTRLSKESWLDESSTQANAITNAHWFCLGGGDGFHVAIDPTDRNTIYHESQGGYLIRTNLETGQRRFLRPSPPEGQPGFRFNWNTPFLLSPHDPTVLWMGGNHVFKLEQRGERWTSVSPDLTTRDPDKMITIGSAAETHCTITTLDESPVRAGRLWVGTDDGKVWTSPDGGGTWTDLTRNVRGMPAGLYVSRIVASHHDANVAYLAVDGHRTDRFEPFLFVTRDAGRTWTSIASSLPAGGPVKVVREDLENPKLLFAGTEFGLYVSFDGGSHWQKPGSSLPTVAVDDLVIHPRERDLIVATHGRSLYVLDDLTGLERWTPECLEAPVCFFAPRPATAYHSLSLSGMWGQRSFMAKNPAFGAYFNYYVKEFTGESVSLTVTNAAGATVRSLSGANAPGFQRVVWDLQGETRERIDRPEWANQPAFVPAGTYTVKLTMGKTSIERKVEVKHADGASDPDLATSP